MRYMYNFRGNTLYYRHLSSCVLFWSILLIFVHMKRLIIFSSVPSLTKSLCFIKYDKLAFICFLKRWKHERWNRNFVPWSSIEIFRINSEPFVYASEGMLKFERLRETWDSSSEWWQMKAHSWIRDLRVQFPTDKAAISVFVCIFTC